ncbi:MAG TPA: hypothetical protein VIL69_16710 [Roseomonas sp.]|jgi:hypothetical protein
MSKPDGAKRMADTASLPVIGVSGLNAGSANAVPQVTAAIRAGRHVLNRFAQTFSYWKTLAAGCFHA